MIQKLSEFALNRDVQILSVLPSEKKSNTLISFTSVKVNIASKNYASIISFVQDIEQSSYPIRIKSLLGNYGTLMDTSMRGYRRSNRTSKDEENEKEYIKATIIIETMDFNNA